MIVRSVYLIGAVVALGVGLAFLVGVLQAEVSIAAVIFVGSVAFMVAMWSVAKRRGTQLRTTTPSPERAQYVPTPGETLQGTVDQFRSWSASHTAPGQRILQGLYGAAMAVLTRFHGLSEDEAVRQLDDGSWTDDPYAAGILSPTIPVPERPRSVRTLLLRVVGLVPFRTVRNRLTTIIEPASPYEIGLNRTTAAIARIGYRGIDGSTAAPDVKRLDSRHVDETYPETRTTDELVVGVTGGDRLQTGYWHGIGILALLAIVVGVFGESSAVILAGVIGMGFAGASRLLDAPQPTISIERTLEDDTPRPSDTVQVRVTVRNESGSLLPDLRIVDGVPNPLRVVDGTARLGTSLRAGQSDTFVYTVEASRGRHQFDPATVITRDAFQSVERQWYVGPETVSVVECDVEVDPMPVPVPLRRHAATYGSTLRTGESGAGTAFHSVREYRRGDPLNRIDWNRHAKMGDLATLEFDEERAVSVLLLVDARRESYLAPEQGAEHAVDRSVTACGRIAGTLLDAGDVVGIAGIGPTHREGMESWIGPAWLSPGSGPAHRDRIQRLLSTHAQLSPIVPATGVQWTRQITEIRKRLAGDTQVIFLTPLGDDVAVEIARLFEAYGHPVTVVSPDPTGEATTSQQLARVGRRVRRFDLQRAGIPVVDWRRDERIESALARAGRGGGR